jgi:hypothetical protein
MNLKMMTHDEIMNIPAGPKMDELIAKIMGSPFRKPTHGFCCTCQVCGYLYDDCVCGYSEDMNLALEIIDKKSPFDFSMERIEGMWSVVWWPKENMACQYAHAETAPLAICRVVLMASEKI